MPMRKTPSPLLIAAALMLTAVLAGCTKGGQFDPTELLNQDMFDTKKKLRGDRTPVFPDGVPGTTTGVPADLVKGYQAPPDEDPAAAQQPAPQQAQAEAKPKPKPKPKVAAAPKPAVSAQSPTRINIGGGSSPPSGNPQPGAQTGAWPPPQPMQGSPAQAMPAQMPTSQSGQTAWPAPPTMPAGGAQHSAQPAQTAWPTPPTTSQ